MANQPAMPVAFDAAPSDPPAERGGAVTLGAIDRLTFSPASGRDAAVKRALDVVVGVAAFVALLPLMLLIAAAVAVRHGGSVFVLDWRIGLGGRRFAAIRFRTGDDDASASAIGRLLFKTRLDELPLILNVLLGDVSLVGPNAVTLAEAARLSAQLPGFGLRHLVPPGLTGWAQVMGQWSDRDVARRLGFDLYYVRHRSLRMDLAILVRTVLLVILGRSGR